MIQIEKVDLSRFCDRKGPKGMQQPFVRGGYRYATNGKIAVRVPAPDEANSEFGINGVEIAFKRPKFAPQAWPTDGATMGDGECWDCCGTGYPDRVECAECDGSGSTVCSHCHHEDDCDDCNGDGWIEAGKPCKRCRGSGQANDVQHRVVGGLHVRGDFDRLIQSLPGVLWAGNNTDKDRIHFVFDGGEGVVMRLVVPGK